MKHETLVTATSTAILMFFIVLALVYGQSFFVPLVISSLFALLMVPASNWLEKLGLSRGLASILSVATIVVVTVSIITFFSYQIAQLAHKGPEIVQEVSQKLDQLQGWLEKTLNISPEGQISYIKSHISSVAQSAGKLVKDFIIGFMNFAVIVTLVVIYTFFFLYYRGRLQHFLLLITDQKDHKQVRTITDQLVLVISRYLGGIFTVIALLALLNSVGLLIIGVKFAVLWGTLAAVLNIIPYIGILIGSLLPITITLFTHGSLLSIVAIIALFSFNQFLEGNFLTPTIVGSQIKVNPLAVITIALLGNLIWGVIGIVLFIPLLGIAKVILDHVKDLQPLSYLIGKDT